MNDVGDLYALMRQAQSQRDAATARAEAAEAELAKVRADLELSSAKDRASLLAWQLAAAQQALRAATEWRPIETAHDLDPKNDVFVLSPTGAASVVPANWLTRTIVKDIAGWLPIPPFATEAQGR